MAFGASQFRSILSSIKKIVSGSDVESIVSEGISQIEPLLSALSVGSSNAVNIYETDENIIVEIQVPGVDRSQLKLWIEGRNLIVSCEKSQINQSNKPYYHRSEFEDKNYTRSIPLPQNTNIKNVHSSILRGILTIKFGKLMETERIEIVIE